MLDVSIIIVNYNTKELTKNCLNSVYDKTKDINFEIILIDNASSDGSQEMIKNEFKDVILIESKENLGFGRANNLGMETAKGKYLFLLNSDTILLNNAVKIFFDYMEKNNINEDIGAIGAYLLNEEKEVIHSYNNFPTIFTMLRDELEFIWKRFIKNKKEKLIDKEVGYITGADLFMPKKVIEKTGKFDNDFFMYYEETELEYRMHKSGYNRLIITGPEIVHLEGKSTTVSNRKRLMIDESRFKYLRKRYNRYSVNLFKWVYIILKILKLIKKEYNKSENREYFSKIFKF